MTSSVNLLTQTLKVTEVTKITVTEIVASEGVQVRAIRIYGSNGDAAPPTVEVLVTANNAAQIQIETPAIKF